MQLLASILMITVLVTVPQQTAGQTSKTPSLAFQLPPALEAALQVMDNVSKALDTMNKHCDNTAAKGIIHGGKKPVRWPLAKDPRYIKYVTACKSEIKQKGVNTKGTDAIFVIMNKFASIKEDEWLLIKTFAPDDETIKKLFK